jgi:hypothetical protein
MVGWVDILELQDPSAIRFADRLCVKFHHAVLPTGINCDAGGRALVLPRQDGSGNHLQAQEQRDRTCSDRHEETSYHRFWLAILAQIYLRHTVMDVIY